MLGFPSAGGKISTRFKSTLIDSCSPNVNQQAFLGFPKGCSEGVFHGYPRGKLPRQGLKKPNAIQIHFTSFMFSKCWPAKPFGPPKGVRRRVVSRPAAG